MEETWVQSLGWEDPLEEVMATHSSISSAGKESTWNAGGLRDMGLIPGLERSPGGGHGNPLQYSRLENPTERGAWQATVHQSHRVGHDSSNLARILLREYPIMHNCFLASLALQQILVFFT